MAEETTAKKLVDLIQNDQTMDERALEEQIERLEAKSKRFEEKNGSSPIRGLVGALGMSGLSPSLGLATGALSSTAGAAGRARQNLRNRKVIKLNEQRESLRANNNTMARQLVPQPDPKEGKTTTALEESTVTPAQAVRSMPFASSAPANDMITPMATSSPPTGSMSDKTNQILDRIDENTLSTELNIESIHDILKGNSAILVAMNEDSSNQIVEETTSQSAEDRREQKLEAAQQSKKSTKENEDFFDDQFEELADDIENNLMMQNIINSMSRFASTIVAGITGAIGTAIASALGGAGAAVRGAKNIGGKAVAASAAATRKAGGKAKGAAKGVSEAAKGRAASKVAALKAGGALRAIPLVGQAATAAFAAYDGYNSYNNAEEILGKDNVSGYDRLASGVGGAIGGMAGIVDILPGVNGVGEKVKTGLSRTLADPIDTYNAVRSKVTEHERENEYKDKASDPNDPLNKKNNPMMNPQTRSAVKAREASKKLSGSATSTMGEDEQVDVREKVNNTNFDRESALNFVNKYFDYSLDQEEALAQKNGRNPSQARSELANEYADMLMSDDPSKIFENAIGLSRVAKFFQSSAFNGMLQQTINDSYDALEKKTSSGSFSLMRDGSSMSEAKSTVEDMTSAVPSQNEQRRERTANTAKEESDTRSGNTSGKTTNAINSGNVSNDNSSVNNSRTTIIHNEPDMDNVIRRMSDRNYMFSNM